ncbi:MAG: AAA family ATPase [Alteromonadaceae bacterium]
MYTAFFGLNEVPFSIAPNPRYLFMSDRHREALSHLTYGLGDTGGFVLLTGEVGTGKTTISRCLMEQLPDNIQSAFILNPTLSSQELLATICDELNIRYRKTGATLKTLTDKIQEKLLKNHQNDINTLLIIDEAQHLQPEVLEQLRLLTNLETNTKKLLQVILIGQPELQQLLRRRDLRQLAQRITARYHLLPLNKSEVTLYIKHRLSVAECHRPIFNQGAMNTIHKLSQGIPRLINLLCHRTLMNAYNTNDAVVNKKCVLKASIEALGDEYKQEFWWQNKGVQFSGITVGVVSVLVFGLWLGKYVITPLGFINNQTENILSIANLEAQNKKLPVEIKAEQPIKVDTQPDNPRLVIKEKLASAKKVEKINDTAEQTVLTKNKADEATNINFQVNSIDGVSNEFLSRFQSAIDETSSEKNNQELLDAQRITNTDSVRSLTDMPDWVQKAVPSLEFDMHIYSSDGEGWVRINGRDRYEGDKIAENLFLNKILPQKVILTYQDKQFSLPALSNW